MGLTPPYVSNPASSNEALGHILSFLKYGDLVKTSLLSRAWQSLVFPHLYRTVYLAYESHLIHFTLRVALDSGFGPLSITANLKKLVIHVPSTSSPGLTRITKAGVNCLRILIPHLPGLRFISWNLDFLPADKEILPLFQTHCPNLDTFNIILNEGHYFYRTLAYKSLFNFKNLTEIAIVTLRPPAFLEDEDCVGPLSDMLKSSPNLHGLVFEVRESKWTFSPNVLLSSLGDLTFPRLRLFQFRGLLDPNWPAFAGDTLSRSHPLRAFLARNPTIEDIVFGWAPHSGEYLEIDPNDAASLFPALKLFRGPAFLCGALVKSPIAKQLESLFIDDVILYHNEEDVFIDTMTKVAGGVTSLPKLRRLIMVATTFMQAWILDKFSNAAPKLEELEFRMGVDNYLEVWDMVARAPSLRKLTVSDALLETARVDMEEDGGNEQEVEDVIESMVRGSQTVEQVRCFGGLAGIWEIDRTDGEVRAFQVGQMY